ncbi:uncharacterized protein LOC113207334 [Frankliniella occidentalis]|uniref:Uncharacterized protein LOC113207334 n=1 Tax=Frankliniella occidentalis TaxID=133901 RepID=A0A9C6XUM6_FRAOC|nr:uncharacterized protein LOC113207334 [Frankliniella occidentalis]
MAVVGELQPVNQCQVTLSLSSFSLQPAEGMEHLPDDVLLMVMELLEVPDLLACRRVCKRIGALALHREAWRHREVDDHDHVSHVLCPVLRLAPCLDTLELTLPFMSDGCLPPFTATRCAVRHLDLAVEPGSAMFAALVLRNQEALGRLKRFTLRFSPEDEDAELLMETLASTGGLERVVLRHDLFSDIEDAPSRFEPLSRLHKTSASSLRMFDCEYARESEELCNFMLAVHAATLELVNLSGDDDATYNYCSSKSAAALLAGMPNLYELTSFPLGGMADVADCASLRIVHLTVCEESRRTVREAAAFLRRAEQLRQVTLDYGHAGTKSSDIGVDLVLAVNPSVEELVIRSRREAPPDLLPQLQALLVAPALRTLRRLELRVDAVPDALLLGWASRPTRPRPCGTSSSGWC